jgi:membrane associated rhomboid family serine protease
MRLGTERYANPYLAGGLLGAVLFSAFLLTGSGLGASGGINDVGLAAVRLVAKGHVDRNAYFAHSAGGSRRPLRQPLVFMILGVVVGGFISGKVAGRVRLEVRKGARISVPTRLALALVGGIITGWGARLARGCTSGQGLSGGATLSAGSWGHTKVIPGTRRFGATMSAGSWAFLLVFFVGGYAMAWFVRRAWSQESEVP